MSGEYLVGIVSALCVLITFVSGARAWREIARRRTRRMVAHVLGRAHEAGLIDGITMHALDGAFLLCERGGGDRPRTGTVRDADLLGMLQDSRRAQAAAKIARIRSATSTTLDALVPPKPVPPPLRDIKDGEIPKVRRWVAGALLAALALPALGRHDSRPVDFGPFFLSIAAGSGVLVLGRLALEWWRSRRKARRGLTLGGGFALLLCALPLAAQDEPHASDQVSLGAAAVVQEDATIVPAAIIGVDFPVYLGHSPVLRAYTLLAIDGAAGETLAPGDVRTFRALRFDAWLQRRIGTDGEGGSTYLAAHVGGAARLDTAGREPFVRAPLWWSAGLVFERRADEHFPHRRAALGFGHSDLSSPPRRVPGSLRAAIRDSAPRDLIVAGHVTVTALETKDGDAVKVIISASLHRALWGTRGTTAAVVSTTVTWGRAS